MKAVAIIFLFVLVSLQTPIGQLLKLPLLIEHFMKHQKDSKVPLLGFLTEHYSADHNDADLPEDEQLPFKKLYYFSIGSALVPPQNITATVVPLHVERKFFHQYTFVLQQHLTNIFHPPQFWV